MTSSSVKGQFHLISCQKPETKYTCLRTLGLLSNVLLSNDFCSCSFQCHRKLIFLLFFLHILFNENIVMIYTMNHLYLIMMLPILNIGYIIFSE